MRESLVTISEAKLGLHKLIKTLNERSILLLRHGKPVAALLDYSRYMSLLDRIEELEDRLAIVEADKDLAADMTVSWEKVKAESGLMGRADTELD